jgi:hypothetical protein
MPAGIVTDRAASAPGSRTVIDCGRRSDRGGGNGGAVAPVRRQPERRGAPRTAGSRARIVLPNLALTLVLALPPTLIHAESRYLLQAIRHTRAAIQAGNAGNLPGLLEQAALAHGEADASDEAEHNVMVENGEIMLEKTVAKARDQKVQVSVVYARDALINLERAAAALGLPVELPASRSAPTGTVNPH